MNCTDYDRTLYFLQDLSIEGLATVEQTTQDDILSSRIRKFIHVLSKERNVKHSQQHHHNLLLYLHYAYSKMPNDDFGEFLEFHEDDAY